MSEKKSVGYIESLYDKLTYFDNYGTSVLIVSVITFFVLLMVSILYTLTSTYQRDVDWSKQRCRFPSAIAGGFVRTPPDGKTKLGYTQENFDYCLQNMATQISSLSVKPFISILTNTHTLFSKHLVDINNSREMIANIRTSLSSMGSVIYERLMNVVIAIQKILTNINDSINKGQGVMTAALYTSLGTYFAMKSFIGTVLDIIIKVLISLSIIILGLWAIPFTWPAAIVLTVMFIAISIPLAIVAVFMTTVLGVKSQGAPRLRCFDENTPIQMNDGTFSKIKTIKCGDILKGNIVVTANLVLTATDLNMYNLNETIISGRHMIFYKDTWIPVQKHPNAKAIKKYTKPYVYCLNTDSKTIQVNNDLFLDWDELFNHELNKILNIMILNGNGIIDRVNKTTNIHSCLTKGMAKNTPISMANNCIKYIQDINIGDTLPIDKENTSSSIVYGVVELSTKGMDDIYQNLEIYQETKEQPDKLYHILTYPSYFYTNGRIINDYNHYIDSIVVQQNNS